MYFLLYDKNVFLLFFLCLTSKRTFLPVSCLFLTSFMKSTTNSVFDSVPARLTTKNDVTEFSQWKNLRHIQFNRGTRKFHVLWRKLNITSKHAAIDNCTGSKFNNSQENQNQLEIGRKKKFATLINAHTTFSFESAMVKLPLSKSKYDKQWLSWLIN
jgi:hypothetical protein